MFDSIIDIIDMVVDKVSDVVSAALENDYDEESINTLTNSVSRVASDFGIPTPEVYISPGSYGEHMTNDPSTYLDDKIGADPKIVDLINGKYGHPRAYDVVMAHEMTHAQIGASGLRSEMTAKCEEMICDAKAGLYAGTHNLPAEVFRGEIGSSSGDCEHPAGNERCEVFERAYKIAHDYPFRDFRPVTADLTQIPKVEALFNDVVSAYNRA